jgi:flagellar hook-associated protein 1 FlgK
MAEGILGSALSGLLAFQRSLEVTSNNISNVNTEGYSRQRVELATRPEQFFGGSYLGKGVDATNITRSYDEFITRQLRSSTSAFAEVDQFYTLSTQVDNIVASEGTSVAPALKSFFNAVHEVANDPSAIPARQVMLSEADSLSQTFNTLNSRFSEFRDQLNDSISNMSDDLTRYAAQIADLNVKIMDDIGRSSGKSLPNGLMDQRDLLLNKISEINDVTVINQADGSASVFIGKGQPLVIGTYSTKISVVSSSDDPSHLELSMDGSTITNQLSGGKLYGSLRFRDEVLDPAQQQLGLMATGLSLAFNDKHDDGYDLQGAAGGAFFSAPSIAVAAKPGSIGSVTATFQNTAVGVSKLVASDFRLDVTATGYTLTQLSNNTSTAVVATLPTTPAGVLTNTLFGFDLDLSDSALAVNDSFLIRPVFQGATNIDVAITDPEKIAAAKSVGIDAITGLPIPGGPGDNRNALELAQLETQNLMLSNSSATATATFADTYGQIVAKVGTSTHGAMVSRSAQDVLLKQVTGTQQDVSGVNLDEEAANLIKFQNAYQASAQAIAVANRLFDSLMGVF